MRTAGRWAWLTPLALLAALMFLSPAPAAGPPAPCGLVAAELLAAGQQGPFGLKHVGIDGQGKEGAGKKAKKAEKEVNGEGVRGEGWTGFTDWSFIVEILSALGFAALLGAAIAYHPKTYGKAATLEEVEQPKIFIMYSVVGAIVGEVVASFPIMGVVIFGIGGLLRFRTDVGAARDTGRVILVTLVGISCGLKVYVVAVLATLVGWILIYLLEMRVAHRVVVKGISQPLLAEAAKAYHEVLLENGFSIMSQKKNFVKGQVSFVFRAPGGLDREELEDLFKDIPPKLQGAPDWEST